MPDRATSSPDFPGSQYLSDYQTMNQQYSRVNASVDVRRSWTANSPVSSAPLSSRFPYENQSSGLIQMPAYPVSDGHHQYSSISPQLDRDIHNKSYPPSPQQYSASPSPRLLELYHRTLNPEPNYTLQQATILHPQRSRYPER